MNQKKIENFTDRLFFSQKSQRLTGATKTGFKTHRDSRRRSFQPYLPETKPAGLERTDIDKLQIMRVSMTSEQYLHKLIKLHQEEKDQNEQATLRIQQEDESSNNDTQAKEDSLTHFVPMIMVNEKDRVKEEASPQKPVRKSAFMNKSNLLNGESKSNKKVNNNNRLSVEQNKKNNPRSSMQTKLDEKNKLQANSIMKSKRVSRQIAQNKKAVDFVETHVKNEYTKSSVSSGVNIDIGSMTTGKSIESKLYDKSKKIISSGIVQTQQALNQIQIENQDEISQTKKIQQICYAEIGRKMVTTTQNQIRRQFFKTNIHIRSYLMRNIVEYVQILAQYYTSSIFILPSERALHFQPNSKPKQLTSHLQHTKYVEIIRNVNHIIQKNIYLQKYHKQQYQIWPYAMLGMFLLLVLMLILMVFVDGIALKNVFMVCTGLMMCIILVFLIGYSLHSYRKQKKFKPVCDMIYQDIDAYFKFVNGKMENNLQWIIGESFFWIQVKIHEKSRIKNKQNFYNKKLMDGNGAFLRKTVNI